MKTRLFRWSLLPLLMAFLHGALLAHEDTFIELKGSTLIGLPARYGPAEFDSKTFKIRIGNHATTLDPYLQSFFETPHDLRFSASWYHSPKTLPPYLLLRIQPVKRPFHYEILLNLDTLQFIDFSIW